jgi:hypothetical protein
MMNVSKLMVKIMLTGAARVVEAGVSTEMPSVGRCSKASRCYNGACISHAREPEDQTGKLLAKDQNV